MAGWIPARQWKRVRSRVAGSPATTASADMPLPLSTPARPQPLARRGLSPAGERWQRCFFHRLLLLAQAYRMLDSTGDDAGQALRSGDDRQERQGWTG